MINLEIFAVKVDDTLSSQRNGAIKLVHHIYGSDIEIKKTPSGKPYIGCTDSIYKYFNISHSGNYTVCGFADVPVGIDIEMIRPLDHRVIDRFLGNCDPDEAIRIWTQRESFGKMTGEGFHDTRYEEIPHMFREYNEITGYIVTVCISRAGGLIVPDTDFPKNITWYQE